MSPWGHTQQPGKSDPVVVRIAPELHRKIYLSAKLSNKSINGWLNEKLERVVNEELKECGA